MHELPTEGRPLARNQGEPGKAAAYAVERSLQPEFLITASLFPEIITQIGAHSNLNS
jgi:hypothetical protein